MVPGTGLRKAAKLMVDIWTEYERDPESVLSEARRAYLELERQRYLPKFGMSTGTS